MSQAIRNLVKVFGALDELNEQGEPVKKHWRKLKSASAVSKEG